MLQADRQWAPLELSRKYEMYIGGNELKQARFLLDSKESWEMELTCQAGTVMAYIGR